MRVVEENGETTMLEVYSGVKLETSEGNCIGVCMRDDTFEISMFKNNKAYPISWHRVNFETKTIEPMVDANTESRDCDNAQT